MEGRIDDDAREIGGAICSPFTYQRFILSAPCSPRAACFKSFESRMQLSKYIRHIKQFFLPSVSNPRIGNLTEKLLGNFKFIHPLKPHKTAI